MTSSRRAVLAIALLAAVMLGAGIAALSSRHAVINVRQEVKALTARVDALEGRRPPTSPQVCNVAPADGEVAIMAAITSCPDGSTVMFPNGARYTQRTTIVVERRKGLTIDGNGSTFTKTGQTPPGDRHPQWVLLETDDSTLRNMTVVGSWTPPPQRQLFPGNQFDGAVSVYGGTNIVVEEITTRNNFGDGVLTAPSGLWYEKNALKGQVPTNIRFRRLDIAGAARHCAAPTAGIGVWIEDSKLTNCFYAGIDAEIDAPREPLHDFHVLRNTIEGYYVAGVMVPNAGATGDIDGVEVRGNTIGESDTCYPPVLMNDHPDLPATLANVVVADNTIRTGSRGVVVNRTAGSVTGNRITKTRDLGCGGANVPVAMNNAPGTTVTANMAAGY
jgi:hypothetical protein